MKTTRIATVTAAALFALVPAWGAEGAAGDAVMEAPRQLSIERLRRVSYQNPDQDVVSMLETPAESPSLQPLPVSPPAPAQERDSYAIAILKQILAEAPPGDPIGKLAKDALEEIRLRSQM